MRHLFEVSWEVCNKVGGIYTLLKSKAREALENFGERYIMLGPALSNNPEFTESDDAWVREFRPALEHKGLKCRLGHFEIPGRPRVILVDFQNRHNTDKLLFSHWQDFGVDSYSAHWDYLEPVLFSTVCGEVIEALYPLLAREEAEVVAHFHEWMSGGGLLYLKKQLPQVGTVFTTHATILGRTLSGNGVDLHSAAAGLHPADDAKAFGIGPKHSLEAACAREADCFTTVSETTAEEAGKLLGKVPDAVVYNGLNLREFEEFSHAAAAESVRGRLLQAAGRLLAKDLPPQTRFFLISGRYEFHNKGIDVFLKSLRLLEDALSAAPELPPVVAWFTLLAGHHGISESVHRRVVQGQADGGPAGLSTHVVADEHRDPILQECNRLNLRNAPEAHVNVIFCPANLNGHDGLFNLSYYGILSACDLGVFPSFYEPWGYTPLESIACGVPTVTSDLAGFGRWAAGLKGEKERAVSVLSRLQKNDDETAADLSKILMEACRQDGEAGVAGRRAARRVAALADWAHFYKGYLKAYKAASAKAAERRKSPEFFFIPYLEKRSDRPRYRPFTVFSAVPESLDHLRDLSYNLWWSWNPEARTLFRDIDPVLWEECGHNPVRLLNTVPGDILKAQARSKMFIEKYNRVLKAFRAYLNPRGPFSPPPPPSEARPAGGGHPAAITPKHPVAYFSTEYGIHETLPVYSGGLGTLSGDHLKAASDLHLPLLGVGLFYKKGYFTQVLTAEGRQVELHPTLDITALSLKTLADGKGDPLLVSVDLPGRKLHAKIWECRVGRVTLYLMDTGIPENAPQDRSISFELYGGDRGNRIKQEILLGMGGVKVIEDILKITPSVYHLNEGHCAFLILERLRRLMDRGCSLPEAREAVRATSVFTTHTPVAAGNEAFDPDLVAHYLESQAEALGLTLAQFLEWGRERQGRDSDPFSMTIFALRFTSRSNAVSRLHGEVSRSMWREVFPGLDEKEVPIHHVTNGVHLPTWVGESVRALLEKTAGAPLEAPVEKRSAWEKIRAVPERAIWQAHFVQKIRLVEALKREVEHDYGRRGESADLTRRTINALDTEALLIGFARRFVAYKRPLLLFQDIERMVRLLSVKDRPLVIVYAGKSHPQDGMGKDLIQKIIGLTRDERFQARVVYLENYSMRTARLLTQGADVWLNNPRRPEEACGTSGMKAAANGVLQLSILDGWWAEGYASKAGFAISSSVKGESAAHQDKLDNLALLSTLEEKVIPLFFQRNKDGIPFGWAKMMKASVELACADFSAERMIRDYYALSYRPAAERGHALLADNLKGVKTLSAWKAGIAQRFGDVKITRVTVKGLKDDTLVPGSPLSVEVLVEPGDLTARELRVELVLGLREESRFVDRPAAVVFKCAGREAESNALKYRLSYTLENNGNYHFGVRLLPEHPLLDHPLETGLVYWV